MRKRTRRLLAAVTRSAIVFAVAVVVIKWLWQDTVPVLFPGAVKVGMIERSVSWVTAAKLAILPALPTFFLIARG